MPVIHFHGTADEFTPYEGGVGPRSLSKTDHLGAEASVAAWVAADDCDQSPVTGNEQDAGTGTTAVRTTWRREGRDFVELVTIRGGRAHLAGTVEPVPDPGHRAAEARRQRDPVGVLRPLASGRDGMSGPLGADSSARSSHDEDVFLGVEFGPDGVSWKRADELAVPIAMTDFVQGAIVTERLRTFGGRPFAVAAHVERLAESLAVLGASVERGFVAELIDAVLDRNRAVIAAVEDVGILIAALPSVVGQATKPGSGTTCGLLIRPTRIDFGSLDRWYREGDRLVVVDVRQVPAECWPSHLKCRSRVHYRLADDRARAEDRTARGLLCHADGTVAEAGIANIVFVDGAGDVISPPAARILPGVSLRTVRDLAVANGQTWRERDVRPAESADAREVWLTSTAGCVWPVVAVDRRPVGDGVPGTLWRRMVDAWSEMVGIDIVAQAERQVDRTDSGDFDRGRPEMGESSADRDGRGDDRRFQS